MEGEKKVVVRLKKGNRLAFTMVYMEYHKRLYGFAFHYLGDRYQAEDAIQWLFLRLWENRQLLNEQMNLKSYLFTSLKNYVLNLLRDGKGKLSGSSNLCLKKRKRKTTAFCCIWMKRSCGNV